MTFTGELGSSFSMLGDIIPGITDSFDATPVDYRVHVLSSKEIRILYDRAVSDSALHAIYYEISPLSSISGTAFVDIDFITVFNSSIKVYVNQPFTFISGPNAGITRKVIEILDEEGSFIVDEPFPYQDSLGNNAESKFPFASSVEFYDSNSNSVKLNLEYPLKWNETYQVRIIGVVDFYNHGVNSSLHSFVANCKDPPLVLGAYLSKRGQIDVVFDRPVGAYSSLATANIRDSSVAGPGTPMIPVVWTSEVPENSVRFIYTGLTPTADSFIIEYAQVSDISGNLGDGETPLALKLNTPSPYNQSSMAQVQVIDAYVSDITKHLEIGTVRVCFNCPVDPIDAVNTALWNLSQEGAHPKLDTANSILSPSCYDLPTLLILVNELKLKYNLHRIQDTVHLENDLVNIVDLADAVDVNTSIQLINQLLSRFKEHFININYHNYPENHNLPDPNLPYDLASATASANSLRISFNSHVQEYYPITFNTSLPSVIGPIQNWASFPDVFAPLSTNTYFVDLRVTLKSIYPRIKVTCTIKSQDGLSTTNPSNETGFIVARSLSDDSYLISCRQINQNETKFVFDKETFISDVSSIELSPAYLSGELIIDKSSTLPTLVWALNQLIFAFNYHLSVSGAGHKSLDIVNPVDVSNYSTSSSLSTILTNANLLKTKFVSHANSTEYHVNSSGVFNIPDAKNEKDLYFLLLNLSRLFIEHNSSGENENTLLFIDPQFSGVHLYPGPGLFFAKITDSFLLRSNGFNSLTNYTFSSTISDSRFDIYLNEPLRKSRELISSFLGVSSRPTLASAVPMSGIAKKEFERGIYINKLVSDKIEIFFSKNMDQVPLDSSIIQISGLGILIKDMYWKDKRTACVVVSEMDGSTSYSLLTVGLKDEFGNSTL